MNKSYEELIKLKTFKERFEYLKCNSKVGNTTFDNNRYLNQEFYKSKKWLSVRDKVIIRDNGCDLGCCDYDIIGEPCVIHHINEITVEDIINDSPNLYDLNGLITTRDRTHKAIHFGDIDLLPQDPIERYPNDTCPWRQ